MGYTGAKKIDIRIFLILDNRTGKTVIFVCPGDFKLVLEMVRRIEYMKTSPYHPGDRCGQFIRPGPF